MGLARVERIQELLPHLHGHARQRRCELLWDAQPPATVIAVDDASRLLNDALRAYLEAAAWRPGRLRTKVDICPCDVCAVRFHALTVPLIADGFGVVMVPALPSTVTSCPGCSRTVASPVATAECRTREPLGRHGRRGCRCR